MTRVDRSMPEHYPRFTDVFFREATVDALHETLESLGARRQVDGPDGSTWSLSTSDGSEVNLDVIEDFDSYSVELYIGVLEELKSVFDLLGAEPRVVLVVSRMPQAEDAAQRVIRDVLAIHAGIAHDQVCL